MGSAGSRVAPGLKPSHACGGPQAGGWSGEVYSGGGVAVPEAAAWAARADVISPGCLRCSFARSTRTAPGGSGRWSLPAAGWLPQRGTWSCSVPKNQDAIWPLGRGVAVCSGLPRTARRLFRELTGGRAPRFGMGSTLARPCGPGFVGGRVSICCRYRSDSLAGYRPQSANNAVISGGAFTDSGTNYVVRRNGCGGKNVSGDCGGNYPGWAQAGHRNHNDTWVRRLRNPKCTRNGE